MSSLLALDRREKVFCLLVVQLGEDRAHDAYERAYMKRRSDDVWVIPAKDVEELKEGDRADYIDSCEAAPNGSAKHRSKKMMERPEIKDSIELLRGGSGQMARGSLIEAMLFGGDTIKMKSVDRVLNDEDKTRESDAVVRFCEIACAAGAEVVYDDGVSIPMRQFFPQFRNSMPPLQVIKKTIDSLKEYVEQQEEASVG